MLKDTEELLLKLTIENNEMLKKLVPQTITMSTVNDGWHPPPPPHPPFRSPMKEIPYPLLSKTVLDGLVLAIVIGHSEKRQGAFNEYASMSEYHFNQEIATLLKDKLSVQFPNLTVSIYYRTDGLTNLVKDVNLAGADLCLSLHCNAFNTEANGTEVLYYERSVQGKIAASKMQDSLVKKLNLVDRGVKGKDEEDRGGYILCNTKMTCILAEPFFIDNLVELNKIDTDLLVTAYAEGIYEYFKGFNSNG